MRKNLDPGWILLPVTLVSSGLLLVVSLAAPGGFSFTETQPLRAAFGTYWPVYFLLAYSCCILTLGYPISKFGRPREAMSVLLGIAAGFLLVPILRVLLHILR